MIPYAGGKRRGIIGGPARLKIHAEREMRGEPGGHLRSVSSWI
jgi:hypothetical protein